MKKVVVSKSPADGSFTLTFGDTGTSQPVAGGTKWVNTHGTFDATLVPGPAANNPATGNETFHASW